MNKDFVLLINVPANPNHPSCLVEPLGLQYLASSLENAGFQVKLIDFDNQIYDEYSFLEFVSNTSPLLVGLSVTSAGYGTACEWIYRWKRQLDFPPIILGGHHPTNAPFDTLKESGSDFVFRGEAEIGLVSLVSILAFSRHPLSGEIPGLLRKNDSEDIYCPIQLIKDLDLITNLFRKKELQYRKEFANYQLKTPLIPVLGSRGCPYRCRFCYNSNPELHSTYRERSVQSIIDEIQEYNQEFENAEFFFIEDCFNFNRSRSVCLAQQLGQLNLSWRCQCRIEKMDEELIHLYANNGCREIYFGIESISTNTVHANKKSKDKDKIYQVLSSCKKKGIRTRGNFMLGFPEETPEDLKKTARFSASLPLDKIEYSFVIPYPGTALASNFLNQEKNIDWKKFNPANPVVLSNQLSEKILRKSYFYAKSLWAKIKQLKKESIDSDIKNELKELYSEIICGADWMQSDEFEILENQIEHDAIKLWKYGFKENGF